MNNSVTNYIIPSFGVPVPSIESQDPTFALCEKIAKYAAFVFCSLAIGSIMGGLPGIIIAGSISAALVLTAVIVKMIWKCTFVDSILPPEILNSIPQKGPQLGQESLADVALCSKVEDSYQWKKKLIEGAEHSIELSANYGSGKAFNDILESIEKRMHERPDLKVHLMCAKELLESENKVLLDRLSINPNFNYIITGMQLTLEPEISSHENHVKLLVVDEKYFVLGGSSITDEMTRGEPADRKFSFSHLIVPKAFCDVDVVGKGEVASTMREEFFKLYSIWERKTHGSSQSHYFTIDSEKAADLEDVNSHLLKKKKVKLFVSGPEHGNQNPITKEYANMIQTAKKTIRLANAQFNPAKEIVDAIEEKRLQNVKVIGQFNHTTSKILLVIPSRINYSCLDEVYEHAKDDVLYHKKIMTIDDSKTIIGSYNFSSKSAYYDHEIALEIDDEEFTQEANRALDEDAKNSVKFEKQNTFVSKIEDIFGHILKSIVHNFT